MDLAWARAAMIEDQLRRRGIRDERVLAAMGRLRREDFVAPSHRDQAYSDGPVDIGYGQTISQPYMTALMAQVLALRGDEKVLEVGGGSGYAAAVLGTLAARVVTVELVPALGALAQSNLEKSAAGGNVLAVCADGSLGYPPEAPYDAVSVAAAAPEIPQALIEQLVDGGRLVIPVGSYDDQDLLLVEKRGTGTHARRITGCRFVPLRGESGWR